ncbi:MAG: ACP S-malonyltransferase [Defluviitaleaceae bacterium]|nr:ACP S-malonyltransferase [Defluviitaleaceae bacterium]
MSLAFLYAGQGSQKEKMGEDFYNTYPQVQEIFDNPSAGFNIADICFNASLETLTKTKYTQPCMAAFGAAVTKLLFEKGIKPDYTAGLSLGEYGALYAAGVFDVDTMLELLAYRGKVMEETTAGLNTKMVAVIGLSEDEVREACKKAQNTGLGTVAPANFNSVGQTVIGGAEEAVAKASEICAEMGARRCLPLNVSAPFHTPYMEEASKLMSKKLKGAKFGDMGIPVIHNATADFLQSGQSVAQLLEIQIKMPVLFQKSIEKLAEIGVDTVVEIGPGNAISGFIKKTAPGIKVYSIEDIESFEGAVKALEA